MMWWDFKVMADLVTAVAAFLAALKSWRAHKEAEETRRLTVEIKNEIKTDIRATLATALQQVQTHSQQVIVNNYPGPPTEGQGKDAPAPIFQQVRQGQLPQPQQTEPPAEQQR